MRLFLRWEGILKKKLAGKKLIILFYFTNESHKPTCRRPKSDDDLNFFVYFRNFRTSSFEITQPPTTFLRQVKNLNCGKVQAKLIKPFMVLDSAINFIRKVKNKLTCATNFMKNDEFLRSGSLISNLISIKFY